MLPIIFAVLVFVIILTAFDLPLPFMAIPLSFAGLGMFKLFSTERTRQRLNNAVKDSNKSSGSSNE